MSSKWTGKVWDLDIDVPSRMVLLAMADHADHNGEHIHAPAPFLAWKTGYKERNVWNILNALIAAGIIVRTDSATGRPNEYKFDFSDVPLKPEYSGMKPKRTADTPAKIAGVGRAKIAGVDPEPLQRLQGLDQTPAKIAGATPAKIAIDHDQYHIESDHVPPPPTNPQPPAGGGGGGFDPQVARLFASYGIKQAEPLARLYGDAFPDVTLEQLRDLCARLDDPTAGGYRGSRLYRALKNGPPDTPPARAAAAPAPTPTPAPTRIELPPDVLPPQEVARRIAERRRQLEEHPHG